MDLYKLLKSLEDFLYEIIVLLVFFPRTLWLSVRYPQRMMDYADTELGDVQSGQYTDTVSPPLFLMLSLGLSYVAGLALHVEQSPTDPSALLGDPERLLIFRVIAFSVLPLFLSLRLLNDLGIKLDRDSLRAPFYSQCFVTAPFATVFGLGLTLVSKFGSTAFLPGVAVLVAGSAWYVRQQAHWFAAKCGSGWVRSWWTATSTFLLGIAAIVAMAWFVSRLS